MKKDFVSTVAGQIKLSEDAVNSISKLNIAFLEMMKDGMTKSDLLALIKRRPERYSRFSGFLDALPE